MSSATLKTATVNGAAPEPSVFSATGTDRRRRLMDRSVMVASFIALGLALLPLVSILYMVVEKGAGRLFADFPYFLSVTMKNVYGGIDAGGILHALAGTAFITLAATIISVPIGLFTAVYLVEYSRPGPLQRAIRVVVDVMTGIPSIVAGLFAAAMFAAFIGPGYRAGIMGAVALAILMIPTIVKTSEEMLRLVPHGLREAAYALGVPRWLVVTKVVLRTAAGGLVTAVMLAIARVIGETAPLLMTVGVLDSLNTNVFEGRMMTLPVYIYRQYAQGEVPCQSGDLTCIATINYDRAWAAALVLLILVMVINLGARALTRWLSPKTGR